MKFHHVGVFYYHLAPVIPIEGLVWVGGRRVVDRRPVKLARMRGLCLGLHPPEAHLTQPLLLDKDLHVRIFQAGNMDNEDDFSLQEDCRRCLSRPREHGERIFVKDSILCDALA